MRISYFFTFIILLITVIVIMSSPSYTGNVVSIKDTSYLLENADDAKNEFNENADNIPGFFKTLFGNEVIKLDIAMANGSNELIYIKMTKGRISYISFNEIENSTLNVFTDEATINNISASTDQIRAINHAFKDGKLSYKSVRFKTKIKTKVAGIGFKIWNIIN